MHRSPLVLVLTLVAVTACSNDSPTNPPLFIPDAASPTSQFLQGVLQVTEDDPPRYAIMSEDRGLVYLLCENIVMDEALLGEEVFARGRYSQDGVFIVDDLHRVANKPTDLDIQKIATGTPRRY